MKILTIGSGSIVHTFFEACKATNHSTITATYSRSLKTAQQLQQEFDARIAYDDLTKALNDTTIEIGRASCRERV